MLKINNITGLKCSKILFYTFNILTTIAVLILCIDSSIIPQPPINGVIVRIGASISEKVENSIIHYSHISGEVMVFYIIALISIIAAIVCFILIKFKFTFDSHNYTWASCLWIGLEIISIIFISIIIFSQKYEQINFSKDNAVATNIGYLFNYVIKDNVVVFNYKSVAYIFISFISVELIAMFGFWLFFTFKIIKHKYII